MITQGEWIVIKHATPDYSPQYGIHNGEVNDFCIVKGENAEDNARLIAAAPETKKQRDMLLAACKCLLADLEGTTELLELDEIPEHIKLSVIEGRNAITAAEQC